MRAIRGPDEGRAAGGAAHDDAPATSAALNADVTRMDRAGLAINDSRVPDAVQIGGLRPETSRVFPERDGDSCDDTGIVASAIRITAREAFGGSTRIAGTTHKIKAVRGHGTTFGENSPGGATLRTSRTTPAAHDEQVAHPVTACSPSWLGLLSHATPFERRTRRRGWTRRTGHATHPCRSAQQAPTKIRGSHATRSTARAAIPGPDGPCG